MPNPAQDITQLLNRLSGGERDVEQALYDHLYQELRQAAQAQLRREFGHVAMQPTELVNETYLRLAGPKDITWQDRSHFLAIAARVMRQVLVDQARYLHAGKRDEALRTTITLSGHAEARSSVVDLVALDEALTALAALDPEQAAIVELRYFGGLSLEETAEARDTSVSTVKRNWKAARLWLFQRLAMAHD